MPPLYIIEPHTLPSGRLDVDRPLASRLSESGFHSPDLAGLGSSEPMYCEPKSEYQRRRPGGSHHGARFARADSHSVMMTLVARPSGAAGLQRVNPSLALAQVVRASMSPAAFAALALTRGRSPRGPAARLRARRVEPGEYMPIR